MLPMYSAASPESLASFYSERREEVQWSPADFPIQQETDWEDADGFYRQASDWLTGLARGRGAEAADPEIRRREWDAVFDRAVGVICSAGRTVMDDLLAGGKVAVDFSLTPLDGDWDPDFGLARRVLTDDELRARPELLKYLEGA
jgi:hypothetical protein